MFSWSFNRNIVECKVTQEEFNKAQEMRFNRNIVECKEIATATVVGNEYVLIETLWNVKALKSLD